MKSINLGILFAIIFLYFFVVYDINFHGPDKPVYFAYTASVVEDGDLNIVDEVSPDFDQLIVSKKYNLPDFHNHGGVIFWVPFYLYAKLIYFTIERFHFLYDFDAIAKSALSFSTIITGFLIILFSYLLVVNFFSPKIALYSLIMLFLGTPFFYYVLFQGGNANIVGCLFSVISLMFCYYAASSNRLYWFLYGTFFSLAVTVKTEIWFQVVFILPFFFYLLGNKKVLLKYGIYFLSGFIPVLFLRAINAYLKYGVVHLEEVIYFASAKYAPTYSFNGLFGSYKGVFYTSPVLYLCLIGFFIMLFNIMKKSRFYFKKVSMNDAFLLFLSLYLLLKMILIGKIFSPAGDSLSIRVLLTEFPVFVLLFAYTLQFFKKYIRFFLPLLGLFILWNLLIISEHIAGLEWMYITGKPDIFKRMLTLSYVADLLFHARSLHVKVWNIPAVIAIFMAVCYFNRRFKKYGSRFFIVKKVFPLFTTYSFIAYMAITILNVFNNNRNVASLKTQGFFKNARIIETSAFKMTTVENEQHLGTLFNMMQFYALEGNDKRVLSLHKLREKLFGVKERSYSYFNKPQRAYINLAESYKKCGRYKKAIACYDKVLQINPYDTDALISLGDIYRIRSDYIEAIKSYEKALDINPVLINPCIRLAHIYEQINNFDKAVEYYKKCIEINPGSVNVYCDLANLYKLKEDYDNAIVYYKKFIGLTFKNADAYKNLAESYYGKKDYNNALKYYKQTIKLNPDMEDAYTAIADIFLATSDYQKAIEYLKKAVVTSPHTVDIYERLADSCNKVNNYSEAIKYYKDIVKIDPANIDAYIQLGHIIYNKTHKYDLAANYYKEALKRNPDSIESYMSLGDLYYYRYTDYDNAISYYQEVIKRVPNSADVYLKIAEIYTIKRG